MGFGKPIFPCIYGADLWRDSKSVQCVRFDAMSVNRRCLSGFSMQIVMIYSDPCHSSTMDFASKYVESRTRPYQSDRLQVCHCSCRLIRLTLENEAAVTVTISRNPILLLAVGLARIEVFCYCSWPAKTNVVSLSHEYCTAQTAIPLMD